jgi:hypothetical protein
MKDIKFKNVYYDYWQSVKGVLWHKRSTDKTHWFYVAEHNWEATCFATT